MRILALLFIVVNLALFTYFNMEKWMPKATVTFVELNKEKIKVLADKDLDKLTKKDIAPYVSALSQPIATCYKWGDFSTDNLASAQVVLVRLGISAEVTQSSLRNLNRRFWVYYPPLASAKKAQEKAQEIKALGVDELYIVQDSKWRHSISFGLFNEEALATKLLNNLKTKGVRNATKVLRNPGNTTSSLLIKNVSPESALRLYKVKPEFVGTEVTPSACS